MMLIFPPSSFDRSPEFGDGVATALQMVAESIADNARWMLDYNAEHKAEIFTNSGIVLAQRQAASLYRSASHAHRSAQACRQAARERVLFPSEPF